MTKTKANLTAEIEDLTGLTDEEKQTVSRAVEHAAERCETLDQAIITLWKSLPEFYLYKGGSHLAVIRTWGQPQRLAILKEVAL
jgi:hypothetical protein